MGADFPSFARSQEVHIMHPFKADFYGLQIQTVVLGYIRPEYNYVNVGAYLLLMLHSGPDGPMLTSPPP